MLNGAGDSTSSAVYNLRNTTSGRIQFGEVMLRARGTRGAERGRTRGFFVVEVHVMHVFFYFYDNNGPVNKIILNRAASEPGRSRLSIVPRGLKKESGRGSSANRCSARRGIVVLWHYM